MALKSDESRSTIAQGLHSQSPQCPVRHISHPIAATLARPAEPHHKPSAYGHILFDHLFNHYIQRFTRKTIPISWVMNKPQEFTSTWFRSWNWVISQLSATPNDRRGKYEMYLLGSIIQLNCISTRTHQAPRWKNFYRDDNLYQAQYLCVLRSWKSNYPSR